MSILRTYNIQNPDSESTNIELSANGGIAVAGIITATSGVVVTGIITATTFDGNVNATSGITTFTGLNASNVVITGVTTVSAGSTSAPSITPSGDSNTGVFFPDVDTIAFAEGGSEAARIDSSGRLLVGTSSSASILTKTIELHNAGTGVNQPSYDVYANTTSTDQAGRFSFYRSRGTSVGSFNAVVSGNDLGYIYWSGADGSKYVPAATIRCQVDGTPGTDDMPGRLVFSTTADGASSPTERMRISSGGAIYQNFASRRDTSNDFSQLTSTSAILPHLELYANNGSFANSVLNLIANRAANNAYSFLYAFSDNAADLEFSLYGDGNGKCDGAWTGGGADYAEYFEWSDGNLEVEDRRGISVVLDGEKIRPAVDGEDPIGVISGNPSVVGDAAWNKWSGKYLRDDYGTYILEDYEVEDEDGNTVIQQRRKLNPTYDPDVEYISREQRPEWDCVGLMGKLRMRKGQPTGSRWIKMRDISDSVEEWLVR